MKVIAIILAVALVVFCFGIAIHFNQNVLQTRRILENERYTRLTAEENLEKATAQIRNLENELGRAQAKIQNTEKLLDQTKSVNGALQERMEEATTLQKSLQQKLEQLQNQDNPPAASVATAGAT